MKSKKILPVILCGGSGSRLWPLSRRSFPKQFLTLNFTEGFSLLQRTQKRIKNIENILEPILICNEEHRFIVAEQMRKLKVKPSAIILEPFARNTAPAIAIAAIKALEIYHDPNLLILSSDHQIDNEEKFSLVIEKALEYSEKNSLVTFGIVPTSPEVGYGYIKSKDELDEKQIKGSQIVCFIEKPDKINAEIFIKDDRFTWNSGIFMFKASVILEELRKHEPKILDYCEKSLEHNHIDLEFKRLKKEFFKKCSNISIDKAVMEKTKKGTVIPLDVGWSDLGSWSSIWDISEKDIEGNVNIGKVKTIDSKNNYLRSENRLVVGIGLENLIIVETNDAILVANKERSQDIKGIVSLLNKKKFPEANTHKKVFRPWGSYLSIAEDKGWQVKRVNVNPGASLSLQKHNYRTEHWIIVSGTALVELEGNKKILKANESTYIPLGFKHRLSNAGKCPLILIEVQSGSYLGEDDIIRFEDNYGRIGFTE